MKFIFNWIIIITCDLCPVFSQLPSGGDVVINEILFNPVSEGYDYVEGYNKSQRPVDIRKLLIAKRDAAGDISGKKPISRDSLNLPPGSYFVVTGNEKWLRQQYSVPANAIVCQLSSMPSFPDDAGTVIFLNPDDSVIDELSYSAGWHFPLLSDPSGVALERIDYALPTQDKNNWASASSSSGYGTPGYKNSQYQDGLPDNEEIIVPYLFSPDNDGINDMELIRFNMREPGFIANTTVYDMSGRKVRYLLKNESIGLSALYKWDGLDERSRLLPQGIYIIVTEMFNLNGETKRFKHAVTLARK